jgi:hypothetical protein
VRVAGSAASHSTLHICCVGLQVYVLMCNCCMRC